MPPMFPARHAGSGIPSRPVAPSPRYDVRRDPSDGNLVVFTRPAPTLPTYAYQAERFNHATGRPVVEIVSPDRSIVATRVERLRRAGHLAVIVKVPFAQTFILD